MIAYLSLTIDSGIGRRLSQNPLNTKNNIPMAGVVGLILLGISLSTYLTEPVLKEYWMNKRIGILYANSKKADTTFITVFFVRRTVFVMVMSISFFAIKYGILMFIQLGLLTYYIQGRPLKDSSLNSIYVFNEVIFLLVLHCLPLYTAVIKKEED